MASNETQKLQSIDLQSLTIQQLSQIKQQLDQVNYLLIYIYIYVYKYIYLLNSKFFAFRN